MDHDLLLVTSAPRLGWWPRRAPRRVRTRCLTRGYRRPMSKTAPTAGPPRWQDYMPIDVIDPALRNAKAHDPETLGASVGRFGFMQPLVLDERTQRLIAGHGRLEQLLTAREAGLEAPEGVVVVDGAWKVPVTRGWASADDEEADAAALALNRVGEGLWTDRTTFEILDALISGGRDLTGTGFTIDDHADLNALLQEVTATTAGVPTNRYGDYGDAGATSSEPSYDERLALYQTKSVRSVVLDMDLVTFQWWTEHAAAARDRLDVHDNASLAVALVADLLGVARPEPAETPDAVPVT
jgi:hypothetical protein